MISEDIKAYIAYLDSADLAGAQTALRQCPALANAVDENGLPAFLHGVATGSEPLCCWLIERSLTKLNARDKNGAGLLHYAAVKGSAALLRYLTEQVGFDPLAADALGRTPYGIAHAAGNTEGESYFAQAVGAVWEATYRNPILPGFMPDPAIVRVGEDYYMVNSSFTYFPALPVSHSRDLIHWELIGHVLTDENTAMLAGLAGGHGYWAPDISWQDGRFYVTATLRRNDDDPHPRAQIVTSAPDVAGPWDAPAVIEEDGIDPSLFTDDDGQRYMLLNRGARLLPLTLDARAAAGQARLLWYGDTKRASEGPHLLKKDGWYYIFMAEGGTGLTHQISVGRSRTLYGPYQPCPYNPIMHQYDPQSYLQKAGHGKPVETQNGEWYMVYLCARPVDGCCPLGRETAIDPITWTADGWPIVNNRRGPSALQKKPALSEFLPKEQSWNPAAPNSRWVSPRGAAQAAYENGLLTLHGDGSSLSDVAGRCCLLTRQMALQCSFAATLLAAPEMGSAGLCCYYDELSYCTFGMHDNTLELIVRLPEGNTLLRTAPASAPCKLKIEADGLVRRFFFCSNGGQWQLFCTIDRAEFLCDEGRGCGKRFTGGMLGVYAADEAFAACFADITLADCPPPATLQLPGRQTQM